eukprot:g224.t1
MEEKFIELANAYEVLSDEEKRKEYDEGNYDDGSEGFRNFQDAFNRHGTGVEDTPFNWAIVFTIVIGGAYPFIMNIRDKYLSKIKKEQAKKQAAIDAVASKNAKPVELTEEQKQELAEQRKKKDAAKAAKRKRQEEEARLEKKREAENTWSVDAPPGAEEEKRKLEEKLRQINANNAKGINNRARGKFGRNHGDWSGEENALLIKGMKKFPSGTPNRWDCISRFIGTRDEDQVVKRVKALKMKTVRKSKSSNNNVKRVVSLSANTKGGKPWSELEQKKLEHGLRTVPKTITPNEVRWDKIAAIVGSRTREQCIARFNELVNSLKKK